MVCMAFHKYSKFEHQFPGSFADVEDNYQYIKLPYVTSKSGRRILFLLDYVPSEDLRSGRLLSGQTGDVFNNLLALAKQLYLKDKYEDFSWIACTFNAFRTAGKPKDFQDQAREVFTERAKALIVKYKPHVVVTFGRYPTAALIPDKLELSRGKQHHWYGVTIPETVEYGGQKHECLIVPTLSLDPISNGDAAESSMMGYVARNLANALNAEMLYKVDRDRINAHTSVIIDTPTKVRKLLDMLRDQPAVAVDTESKNLNRITNSLLTIQFAKCTDFGYLIPLKHKDTPFIGRELNSVLGKLQDYFEGNNTNDYHVYANADFDLNLLRSELGCQFMHNDVWDIFGGEWGLDENMKFLSAFTGEYYYSLGNLATQYGFEGYLTSTFGKGDRKTIVNRDLDTALVRYSTLDVVVPFQIHEQQKLRGADAGNTSYETLIRRQISDTIHTFSRMENNGNEVDVKYLFHLKTPQSPIEKVIQTMTTELMETPAVKKANKILMHSAGIPQNTGGWGAAPTSMFSLRKDEHKHVLFFDVLLLEPVAFGKGVRGKKPAGKLDKKFQEKYAEVPEVKMFTELGKAKKLKQAYVNTFLHQLATDEDFRKDHRIRPSYNYLVVVTGRTSASDPNLQQVPSRSELGKHIKRLFVSGNGFLYIKVDYRVHEVRGWGIISFDRALAGVFEAAKALRDQYRHHPTAELAKRLKLEADVHVINAAYFFTVAVEAVDKVLRNNVKGVIFGLIYQMSIKMLAATIKKELEFTKKLVRDFNKRFPKGMKWITACKDFAREHLYYENPNGFRRHLWGYCLPKSCQNANRIHAEMDRRAVNSPIQGMCAQFMAIGSRKLDTMWNAIRINEDRDTGLKICNSVHDSLENISPYQSLLENIAMVEVALTTGVREEMYKRYGFEFVVDLEVDFEIGSTLSNCQPWDFSLAELERITYESIKYQRDDMGLDVDVDSAMTDIFVSGWKHAPKWIKRQSKNIGWKMNLDKFKKDTSNGNESGKSVS